MNDQIKQIRSELERRICNYKEEKSEENIGHRDRLILGARMAQCEELLSYMDAMESAPKFRVGDIVRSKKDGIEAHVTRVDRTFVYVACEDWEQIIDPNDWEVVEPAWLKEVAAMPKEEIERAFEKIRALYPIEDNTSGELDTIAKKLWDEINTGHQYSVLDSYNQFYGICLEVCEWYKQKQMDKF